MKKHHNRIVAIRAEDLDKMVEEVNKKFDELNAQNYRIQKTHFLFKEEFTALIQYSD